MHAMKKKLITLDYKLLPIINYGRIFIGLEKDAATGIARFKRLSERANNAIRFSAWSQSSFKTLGCPESEVKQLQEGCFRAALVEFGSMEEIQILDYKENGITKDKLRLNDTTNPLLHIFRGLRNQEVHLQNSTISETQIQAMWGHIDNPDEATPITISKWFFEGITPESFNEITPASRRKNYYYSPDQIKQMVDWLNTNQETWGIHEIFCLAVEEYCRVLNRYTNNLELPSDIANRRT